MTWYNRESERGIGNWNFGAGAVVGACLYKWDGSMIPVVILFSFMLALGLWRVWRGARQQAMEDFASRRMDR